MNGKRYLLDTNAVIQLLAGNPSIQTESARLTLPKTLLVRDTIGNDAPCCCPKISQGCVTQVCVICMIPRKRKLLLPVVSLSRL